MEQLKIKYNTTSNALNHLKKVLNIIEINKTNLSFEFIKIEDKKQEYEILRESLIQRFEYCVDTLWKYLKLYFFMEKGIDQSHPKPIFRECFKANLATEKETEKLIEMVDSRNMTSHAYKELVAASIYKKIPSYYLLMNKIIKQVIP